MKHFFYICCTLCLSLVNLHSVHAPPISGNPVQPSAFWLWHLVYNLLGYATVVVPAMLFIYYMKKIKYNERGSGICFPVIKSCVFGDEAPTAETVKQFAEDKIQQKGFLKIIICASGLQISYLTWGVIQERIMTQEYGKTDAYAGEKFSNSQFLVFVNRLLAVFVAGMYTLATRQPRHTCPLYKFSYASFSNIMSSWFQYEALKFVTFPTQVLGKACKVIPVMLMGKLVSGNVYEVYEWITAGMLSIGISMFLLFQGSHHSSVQTTEETYSSTVVLLSGLTLMLGYMAFDSFTSNWQGSLFKTHKMSSVQMMFGVNLFSCIFTSCSLLEQGGFVEASQFMFRHWDFAVHSVVLSLCSAVGQLFIFYTISEFGAVIFTVIMTVRQAIAILLSCIIYGHPVTLMGLVGIFVVFLALFLRIYARSRKAALKQAPIVPN
uniref:Adenosine 3'-phospho 5'-phosphosulfate transporter 1 n=1 Tax=Ciona savignyi TaxID=51511 RepID=H2Z5A4_CIOSA